MSQYNISLIREVKQIQKYSLCLLQYLDGEKLGILKGIEDENMDNHYKYLGEEVNNDKFIYKYADIINSNSKFLVTNNIKTINLQSIKFIQMDQIIPFEFSNEHEGYISSKITSKDELYFEVINSNTDINAYFTISSQNSESSEYENYLLIRLEDEVALSDTINIQMNIYKNTNRQKPILRYTFSGNINITSEMPGGI